MAMQRGVLQPVVICEADGDGANLLQETTGKAQSTQHARFYGQ